MPTKYYIFNERKTSNITLFAIIKSLAITLLAYLILRSNNLSVTNEILLIVIFYFACYTYLSTDENILKKAEAEFDRFQIQLTKLNADNKFIIDLKDSFRNLLYKSVVELTKSYIAMDQKNADELIELCNKHNLFSLKYDELKKIDFENLIKILSSHPILQNMYIIKQYIETLRILSKFTANYDSEIVINEDFIRNEYNTEDDEQWSDVDNNYFLFIDSPDFSIENQTTILIPSSFIKNTLINIIENRDTSLNDCSTEFRINFNLLLHKLSLSNKAHLCYYDMVMKYFILTSYNNYLDSLFTLKQSILPYIKHRYIKEQT